MQWSKYVKSVLFCIGSNQIMSKKDMQNANLSSAFCTSFSLSLSLLHTRAPARTHTHIHILATYGNSSVVRHDWSKRPISMALQCVLWIWILGIQYIWLQFSVVSIAADVGLFFTCLMLILFSFFRFERQFPFSLLHSYIFYLYTACKEAKIYKMN